MGKSACRRATWSRSRPRSRCSHSGARLPGCVARQQQRPRRVLPKTQGEQGAVGQLLEDQALDVFRRDPLEKIEDRLVGVGQADQDAVVVVQTLRTIAEPLAQPCFQGQPQAKVHAAAQRTEQDHLPIAELIARRLDDERPIGRHAAGAPSWRRT